MCYTGRMIKIATWPTRKALSFAVGLALDVALGKSDPMHYISCTTGPR
jgi:hypothetical protein